MSKLVVYCKHKTITISNDIHKDKIDFLVDYQHNKTFDVFSLTREEASLISSVIKAVLGDEKILSPIEKVQTP